MSTDDKFDAATDKLGGKAKEAAGNLTGNEQLEAEGKTDQIKGHLKDAVENVKDIFK